jgi:hypothetical protein
MNRFSLSRRSRLLLYSRGRRGALGFLVAVTAAVLSESVVIGVDEVEGLFCSADTGCDGAFERAHGHRREALGVTGEHLFENFDFPVGFNFKWVHRACVQGLRSLRRGHLRGLVECNVGAANFHLPLG